MQENIFQQDAERSGSEQAAGSDCEGLALSAIGLHVESSFLRD
jgi:hypothetical protein